MNKQYLIIASLVLAVGVGAFFAGMQYQKSQRGSFGGDRQGNFMMGGGR